MKDLPGLSDLLILLFLAVPILVILRMFWLYWRRGRDPERDTASVQYEPPDKLTPGECGALLENTVAVRSITATIVDLSVKGYLAIAQENDGSAPASKDHKNYVFHMLKGPSEWQHLKPHEQAVLRAIFIPTNPLRMLSDAMSQLQNAGGNPALASAFSRVQAATTASPELRALSGAGDDPPQSAVALMDLQNHFYLHLGRIRESVFDALVADGYYENRPDRVRLLYIAKGVVVGTGMAVAGVLLAAATGAAPFPLVLAGILTGVIIVVCGRLLSSRTIAGTRTLAKVLGFKDFLERVEKDHIQRLEGTPDLFEKYLPYAMALHVEKKWSQAFGGVSVPPPQWYQRKHGVDFFPMHLIDDLNGMSNQAESVLTSKPGS
ncbi:MAG: DUF2207 domain-containing protein [Terriglobales bacterium]